MKKTRVFRFKSFTENKAKLVTDLIPKNVLVRFLYYRERKQKDILRCVRIPIGDSYNRLYNNLQRKLRWKLTCDIFWSTKLKINNKSTKVKN